MATKEEKPPTAAEKKAAKKSMDADLEYQANQELGPLITLPISSEKVGQQRDVKFSGEGTAPPGVDPHITGGRRNRRTRKSVRILIKHEGDLSKLGYSMGKSVRSRHASLKKAVKRYGRLATSRKLGALAVFNKRRHPGTARKARSDRKFVMK
jgi:hypothetical protein